MPSEHLHIEKKLTLRHPTVHDMVEVLKYKNSLAPSNPVLKLFNTLEQKNHEVAIKEISQGAIIRLIDTLNCAELNNKTLPVLKARSHIIIGYVRLCKLYNLIKEYEESIKAAQKGAEPLSTFSITQLFMTF